MTLPVRLHSGMTGAPSLTPTNGGMNALFNACLVNGFNTQSVTSATASGGVVTFNFASAPGFSALDTVTIAGASNATVNGQKRVQSAASNQVLVEIPGVPDGAVGGTITLKFSPLGWTRAFSGTGIGAYRQGGSATHKRFLRVFDNTMASDFGYSCRGYENMTAISTGTGPFPTVEQAAGNGIAYHGGNAAVQSWAVVGTPRFFYFFTGYGTDATGNLSAFPLASTSGFHFGEIADVQKAADVYAYIMPSGVYNFTQQQYTPRAYTGTGTSLLTTIYGPGGASTPSIGLTDPDPGSGHTLIAGQLIVVDQSGSGSFRGFVPGTLGMYTAPVGNGSKLPMDILTGVTGVSGRVLLCTAYGGGGAYGFSVLLDEDWGDT